MGIPFILVVQVRSDGRIVHVRRIIPITLCRNIGYGFAITSRGLGFIDKIIELATADGKSVAVIGNEYYVNNCKDKGDEASADIIIEVAVPAQTTVELCATEASVILNKADNAG